MRITFKSAIRITATVACCLFLSFVLALFQLASMKADLAKIDWNEKKQSKANERTEKLLASSNNWPQARSSTK
jgi:hypothetical protein